MSTWISASPSSQPQGNPAVRAQALDALTGDAPTRDGSRREGLGAEIPEGLSMAVRGLTDPEPAVREAAVRALGRLRPSVARVRSALGTALADRRPPEEHAAICVLRRSIADSDLEALSAAITSDDAQQLCAALQRIGAGQAPDERRRGLRDEVRPLLGHTEPEVRIAAVLTLSALGCDVADLAKPLADPDPGVRAATCDAATALLDASAAGAHSLTRMLLGAARDPAGAVRCAAARGLGRRSVGEAIDEDALRTCGTLTEDEDAMVRIEGLRALARLGRPAAPLAGGIAQRFLCPEGRRERPQFELVEALRTLAAVADPGDEPNDAVLACCAHPLPRVRAEALRTATQLHRPDTPGGDRATLALVDALDDGVRGVRYQAIDLLAAQIRVCER